MRFRLSVLMALVYAVPGAVLPLFSLHLQGLNFSPYQIAWACATQSAGMLLAPLLAGQMADRWFPAQYCLAVFAALAALALWLLAGLDSPLAVTRLAFGFWGLCGPCMVLSTTLCFAHLEEAERRYGPVRMWGTVGWMVASWVLGLWLGGWLGTGWLGTVRPGQAAPVLADMFRLASLLSLVLAGYALTLPHTPPARQPGLGWAPVAALRLLGDRDFAVYVLGSFVVTLTMGLNSQASPLLLHSLGVPKEWQPYALSMAQVTEVLALGLLPGILGRLGMRATMILGLAAWTTTLGIFALGRPAGLVVGSLAGWGVCVCCYLIAGQVLVHKLAHGRIRASAQSLLSASNATGSLVGSFLAGALRQASGGSVEPVYTVAVSLAVVVVALFCWRFQRNGTAEKG